MIASIPAMNAQLDPDILPVADLEDRIRNIKNKGNKADQIKGTKEKNQTKEQHILMTKENYYETIKGIYEQTAEYNGKTIETSGIVFQRRTNESGEFGVGLYYMTCCAADSQLLGLRYKTTKDVPPTGKRVKVS